MSEAKKVESKEGHVEEVFGIAKDFDDLENFLFGLKVPGAIHAFRVLGHIRAVADKRGMKVF